MRRRLLLMSSILASGVLTPTVSCTVGSLDLEGKSCPCVDGYVCDASRNVCVLPSFGSEPEVGAAEPDGGVGGEDVGAPSSPSIVLSKLTSPWQTAHTIRWNWKVDGDADSFLSYQIAWAESVEDVETGAGATIISSAQKIELGAFDARGGKTNGPVDVWTTTHGHAPGKTYVAKVTATDKRGLTSTLIASATTTRAPTMSRVLFDGTRQWTATPAAFEFRTPDGGEEHYYFSVDCAANATTCANHLELGGIGCNLADPSMTADDFAGAFLEVRVSGTFAADNFSSAVAIEPANCMGSDDLCEWRFTGWTQRSGSQPVLQVPLRELENASGKLTYATLESSGFVIDKVAISGTWKDAAALRFSDARIRW